MRSCLSLKQDLLRKHRTSSGIPVLYFFFSTQHMHKALPIALLMSASALAKNDDDALKTSMIS